MNNNKSKAIRDSHYSNCNYNRNMGMVNGAVSQIEGNDMEDIGSNDESCSGFTSYIR